eukprot:TRINITY_DN26343_c0_g1_i1.p1 TRINITY_DN26343_c0_g1~~TRINITY_DN26343_c0_g1_i1.p1  ORF type:complete len:133 (-),score=38.47 TRINITY_DN26343_c0_g1_i1:28-393(-)
MCIRDRLGTFFFEDGSTYHGMWMNDYPNGLGIFAHVTGKLETGFFKDGMLHGVGRILFRNGSYYYGGFFEGKYEGTGLIYHSIKRKWVFGLFKDSKKLRTIAKGRNLPPPCYCNLQDFMCV